MAKVDVKCPFCEQTESVRKRGRDNLYIQFICDVDEITEAVIGFSVACWCTDNFSAYDMLPDEKQLTGKFYA